MAYACTYFITWRTVRVWQHWSIWRFEVVRAFNSFSFIEQTVPSRCISTFHVKCCGINVLLMLWPHSVSLLEYYGLSSMSSLYFDCLHSVVIKPLNANIWYPVWTANLPDPSISFWLVALHTNCHMKYMRATIWVGSARARYMRMCGIVSGTIWLRT